MKLFVLQVKNSCLYKRKVTTNLKKAFNMIRNIIQRDDLLTKGKT
jgi:hypothetical protein